MPTVLIVDDEQHIRLLIEQTLEELEDDGVELLTATDGEEALDVVANQHPDLVFLDVMMPRKNGFEVCRASRPTRRMPARPSILLTAKGQAYDREQGMAAGADLYLTKPFDPDDLLARARAGPRPGLRPADGRRGTAPPDRPPPPRGADAVACCWPARTPACTITDLDGAIILDRQAGAAPADAPVDRHPIMVEGATVGWVEGPRPAGAIAAVLSYACAREKDKRALAREALDRYRELNLIYDLAEQIGADARGRCRSAGSPSTEAGRLPSGGEGFVSSRMHCRAPGRREPRTAACSGSSARGRRGGDRQRRGRRSPGDRGGTAMASIVAAPLRVRGERLGVIGTRSRDADRVPRVGPQGPERHRLARRPDPRPGGDPRGALRAAAGRRAG